MGQLFRLPRTLEDDQTNQNCLKQWYVAVSVRPAFAGTEAVVPLGSVQCQMGWLFARVDLESHPPIVGPA